MSLFSSFGSAVLGSATLPQAPKRRGRYAAGTRVKMGWGLTISDFMPPLDRRKAGPRPMHAYRWARRLTAKAAYRANVKRPGFTVVAAR